MKEENVCFFEVLEGSLFDVTYKNLEIGHLRLDMKNHYWLFVPDNGFVSVSGVAGVTAESLRQIVYEMDRLNNLEAHI